ncbi:MAG: DUF1456 family protein [Vallitaleaceae bacterium]|nr:DUF1456 family protein [Vallitaleaceae bacterium]
MNSNLVLHLTQVKTAAYPFGGLTKVPETITWRTGVNNNDILIRLRYALDIKNTDMVEIFKLGGIPLTKEEVLKILQKPQEDESDSEDEGLIKCTYFMMESFLNGFILFNRGKPDIQEGQVERPVIDSSNLESVNNILLKKLKIALSLTSDDMLEVLALAGVTVSKGELSAIFRKVGQRNYKECGDKYVRNFLKGLAIKYREVT